MWVSGGTVRIAYGPRRDCCWRNSCGHREITVLLAKTKNKAPAAFKPGTGQGRLTARNGGAAPDKKSSSVLLSGSGQRNFTNSNLNPIPQGEGNG
jgi:hypothetical protein